MGTLVGQHAGQSRRSPRQGQTHALFVGAVVLDPQKRDGLIGVELFHIIDGQQRLTTLQFALASLLLALRNSANDGFANIVTGCPKNGNPGTMRDSAVETFKVWLTFLGPFQLPQCPDGSRPGRADDRFKPHFTHSGELCKIGIEHPPAVAAFWYFTSQFEQLLVAVDGQSSAARAEALVLAILRDLKLVSIVLGADDDA